MVISATNVQELSHPMGRSVWTLSVVIPAYNEENGIGAIIERVLAIKPDLAQVGIADLEVIVVDDGSSDRTAEIAQAYPQVRLIRHETNKGYGAALKTGFRAARGELLGFLDADGTYPPESFPKLCAEALQGADLVVGSRRSGNDSEMPVVRRVGNFLWSHLVSLLSNYRVVDPASGMRVFRSSVFQQLCPLPDGLNFTPVMSTRAVHEGLRMIEVPISYEERAGRSKLSVVRDGTRFLRTIIWTSLNYNPVRVLGGLGLGALVLGGLVALGLVIARLRGITTLGPWGVAATFVAVVLGIAGVDLFALGATFNYLVSLFHSRPMRQGLFGRPLFRVPLDRHFWWFGGVAMLSGMGLGVGSLILALGGWPIERLWLYLLAGVMWILVGVQLVIFWVIMRVLEELSQRSILAQADAGMS
ncbi:MAG: glycosyltransferase family 2 protein [Chloroflexi bacterium]|nr:glycosyltransferase family 2 protein [Chloroflexota bacterium]